MRKLACFLLLLSGSAALQAAETWRWVDANGVVHFSDRPVPGAERVDLGSRVTRPATPAPPAVPAQPAPATSAGDASVRTEADGEGPRIRPYTRCAVTRPEFDEVFHGVQSVVVSLDLQPGLQSGHHVEVQLNGSAVQDWPADALRHELTQMYRGSYTLTVRVLDAQGRAMCTGAAHVFHVRQPSLLSPARPRN